MAPFLPIRAWNRSQRVRIGGKNLSPNETTYVDLGELSTPIGVRASTATTGGTGLAASTEYFYKVVAIDTYGGETLPSAEVNVTTGTGATNSNTLSWLPVANASGYNVYRSTTTGTETLVASGVLTAYFVDTGVTKINNYNYKAGKALPTKNNTSYSDISRQNVKKELSYHSAIGAFYVVGPITASSSQTVVVSGLSTTVANLVVTVASGEVENRSTGIYTAVTGGTTTLSAASATEDRTDLVWVNTTTGAVGHTSGTPASVHESVPPVAPEGTIPVAAYLVAKEATAAVLVADLRPRP